MFFRCIIPLNASFFLRLPRKTQKCKRTTTNASTTAAQKIKFYLCLDFWLRVSCHTFDLCTIGPFGSRFAALRSSSLHWINFIYYASDSINLARRLFLSCVWRCPHFVDVLMLRHTREMTKTKWKYLQHLIHVMWCERWDQKRNRWHPKMTSSEKLFAFFIRSLPLDSWRCQKESSMVRCVRANNVYSSKK